MLPSSSPVKDPSFKGLEELWLIELVTSFEAGNRGSNPLGSIQSFFLSFPAEKPKILVIYDKL